MIWRGPALRSGQTIEVIKDIYIGKVEINYKEVQRKEAEVPSLYEIELSKALIAAD